MNFAMPIYADANDAVDRALCAQARDMPVSFTNLTPALRWRLSWLELSEQMLAARVRQRASELDVTLVD